MTRSNQESLRRFVGFDTGGEVFLCQDRVWRGIYSGKGALYLQVLRTCQQYKLFQYGIVTTQEARENPCPDLPYELVLEHEKIPFVSYPHEWSASMLKDAALLHIELFLRLGQHGLTIKDWHPYNIVFKGPEPVFVDFTSIIPIDRLKQEEYLTPPHVTFPFQFLWETTSAYMYEMYWRMCLPYFLFPLYLMRYRHYSKARTRLFESVLNTGGAVMTSQEVFSERTFRRKCLWGIYKLIAIFKKLALLQRHPVKSWFLKLLRQEIAFLSVSPSPSAYSGYYETKNESFDFEPSPAWNAKQQAVYEAIVALHPPTVLDVASNTGWFSLLAAKLGGQVVAFDIDETCIDLLYKQAKKDNLSILPLVINLNKLTPNVPAFKFENEPQHSLIGGDFPLLLTADKRLKCNMVLALAIVHHLALGQGKSFAEILQTLTAFTDKYLLVEFVPQDDNLIVAEPDFFPAFNANPHYFDWYTLENFIQELSKYFQDIDLKQSYPDSRAIFICKK